MPKTNELFLNLGLLVLRVLCGAGVAYHGFQKIFGGMMDKFASGVGAMGFPVPTAFAWAAALSEFGGGLLLILGLQTRVGAFLVFAVMSVAAFIAQKADAFQMKELALAYWAMSGAILLTGPGRFSLDRDVAEP